MDSGHTAWMLAASALVLLMTPRAGVWPPLYIRGVRSQTLDVGGAGF